jgi:hypothetical protein
MKEIHEFRVFEDRYHLLHLPNNAKYNGSVYVLKIEKKDVLFQEIEQLDNELRKKGNAGFGIWSVKRIYTQKELENACIFHLKIKTVFEPTGEECGTLYDETAACEICGANRKQVSPLSLKKGTIPKKDIARTIGGEVVVSEKFVNAARQRNLKGLQLSPVNVEKYYQLTADMEIELSPNTIAGDNPFETSAGSDGGIYNISGYEVVFEKEVYICPKGDLIGLNLLSEPYVTDSPLIKEFDFFASRQKIGVKRGLLRPEPIYFCSPSFRQMVEDEKLSGFEFEIANIE